MKTKSKKQKRRARRSEVKKVSKEARILNFDKVGEWRIVLSFFTIVQPHLTPTFMRHFVLSYKYQY